MGAQQARFHFPHFVKNIAGQHGASSSLPKFRLWTSILLSAAWLGAASFNESARATETVSISPITGRWLTASGNLEVEIAPCGTQKWCGTVVKVLNNRSMSGPGAMQAADKGPVEGLVILEDLQFTEGGHWQGRIYNRENGLHYPSRVFPEGPQQLAVEIQVAPQIPPRLQVWTRVISTRAPEASREPVRAPQGAPGRRPSPESSHGALN